MADPRIIAVELDERTIIWRNADVEQERRIAIFDLLEGNYFCPKREYPDGYAGPFRVTLRVEEGRLAIDIASEDDQRLETIIFGLARFRRPISWPRLPRARWSQACASKAFPMRRRYCW